MFRRLLASVVVAVVWVVVRGIELMDRREYGTG
jgi:hypothetical protein